MKVSHNHRHLVLGPRRIPGMKGCSQWLTRCFR